MTRKKKTVGTTGRFGPRYGKTIRGKIAEIEQRQRSAYECPYCHKKKVKRVSVGIWQCHKCGVKFAGKAYTPWET